MTFGFAIHGEVGGRAGNGESEGFTADTPSRLQFVTSIPRTNLAGNGGKYSVGCTNDITITPDVLPHVTAYNFREQFFRVSMRATDSSGARQLTIRCSYSTYDLFRIYWDGTQVLIYTLVGQSLVQRGTLTGFEKDVWHTLWVYFRTSTATGSSPLGASTTGYSANADGRIRIFNTDPHVAGSTPILDFTGEIYFSWSSSTRPFPTLPTQVFLKNTDYIDDMVCQIPSIDYVSATASLPAYGDLIKYTDGSGNAIRAYVHHAHQTGTDGSGNAVGILLLTHMAYTPSGGSATAFDGMSWGGVTQPWGTGSVAITDDSGSALGTGAYNYARGTLPKDGVFMPAAKPITASTTMTTSAGTAADSFQLVDDFGGDSTPSDYVYGDAAGEYWTGQFDDDTSSGTDKLVVAGNPGVNRVLTYVWGRQQGSGGAVTGEVKHYNVATGDPIGSRDETIPFALTSAYGLTIGDHLECSTSSAGTTTPWTVTNLNAASFGIIAE